jgi:hypothetical protein
MTLTAAAFALLLDIRDFAAGRELAIPADDAATGESGEAKKSNETHRTLTRIAMIAERSSNFCTEEICFSALSAHVNYRRRESEQNINSMKNLPIVGARFSRLDNDRRDNFERACAR